MHGLAQIEGNVVRLASPECEPDQRWIEKKIPRSRHQNNLVLAFDLSHQRFGGDDSAKPPPTIRILAIYAAFSAPGE